MSHYLFIYGTLLPGLRLHAHMQGARWQGAAHVPAHLHDIGGYPGLVRCAPGDTATVAGEVCVVDEVHLLRLDQLEGVVPHNKTASHYLRQRVTLHHPAEHLPAEVWTYFFNRSVANCPRVHGGDYRAYLADKA